MRFASHSVAGRCLQLGCRVRGCSRRSSSGLFFRRGYDTRAVCVCVCDFFPPFFFTFFKNSWLGPRAVFVPPRVARALCFSVFLSSFPSSSQPTPTVTDLSPLFCSASQSQSQSQSFSFSRYVSFKLEAFLCCYPTFYSHYPFRIYFVMVMVLSLSLSFGHFCYRSMGRTELEAWRGVLSITLTLTWALRLWVPWGEAGDERRAVCAVRGWVLAERCTKRRVGCVRLRRRGARARAWARARAGV
jgi:hypothetical protein